ncbi:MAG: DUF6166 domain-containing protein [Gemmataceae bacterium]
MTPGVAYVARRDPADGRVSVVKLTQAGDELALPPRTDLRNHSPAGFGLSHAGSGPAQTALALLADALGNDDLARDLYQAFKAEVVARVPDAVAEWHISRQDILDWAEQVLVERAGRRGLPPEDALLEWAHQSARADPTAGHPAADPGPEPGGPLFPLGRVVATPGALAALAAHPGLVSGLLGRHARGDWGEVDRADARANAAAVRAGGRILSAYATPAGDRLWVLTEADRSSTCLLTPDEY